MTWFTVNIGVEEEKGFSNNNCFDLGDWMDDGTCTKMSLLDLFKINYWLYIVI